MDEEEFRGYDQTPAWCCRPTCATPTATSTSSSAGRRSAARVFNLRLVKGAYWDYETVLAAQEGWPVPVFTHKPDTDAMYEQLARTDARASATMCGRRSRSHNVRSLAVRHRRRP